MTRRALPCYLAVMLLLVVACTACMVKRVNAEHAQPVCSCVLGDPNPPDTFAGYADKGYDDPADCPIHHSQVD